MTFICPRCNYSTDVCQYMTRHNNKQYICLPFRSAMPYDTDENIKYIADISLYDNFFNVPKPFDPIYNKLMKHYNQYTSVKREYIPTTFETYTCPRCEYSTDKKCNMIRHIESKNICEMVKLNISGDDLKKFALFPNYMNYNIENANDITISAIQDTNKYKCDTCQFICSNIADMRIHYRKCYNIAHSYLELKGLYHTYKMQQTHNIQPLTLDSIRKIINEYPEDRLYKLVLNEQMSCTCIITDIFVDNPKFTNLLVPYTSSNDTYMYLNTQYQWVYSKTIDVPLSYRKQQNLQKQYEYKPLASKLLIELYDAISDRFNDMLKHINNDNQQSILKTIQIKGRIEQMDKLCLDLDPGDNPDDIQHQMKIINDMNSALRRGRDTQIANIKLEYPDFKLL